MLQLLHDGLWICPVPYSVSGLQLGRQLVAVRLASGGLWIHSPIPVTPTLRAALGEIGPVEHVVGPNCWHDECLEEFQAAYPEATFHAAPGLAANKPQVRFARELGATPDVAWSGVLSQHLVGGMPRLNEIVFFHAASRTLVIADLAFNFGPGRPWLLALAMRLNGAWGRFTPTRLCKSLMADKPAVRASIDQILSWDFDRILVGHGRNIETGGRRAWSEAFSFLA